MRGGGFSLIIIILLVFAGIYYWSNGISSQLNTPVEVLNTMELDTEIAFLSPSDTDFKWNVAGDDGVVVETTATGSQISAAEPTSNQVDSIYDFLIAQGFEEDIINTVDETTDSLRGFIKGNLVCTVLYEVVGDESDLDTDSVTYHVVVSCGIFEREEKIEEVVGTDEEQIAMLFANRYDKPVDEVEIVVENRIKVFASGSVKFAGEPGGSIWLAFNNDSGWELVFDGNSSVTCADIEGYGFPTDMVSECTDADGVLVTLV